MGQIDVTDAWLYKYMSIVDEAIINEIEKNVNYDYAFSDEFNRKMERTIRKEKFIPFWNSVSKFGKSVAIFALVIVTSLFAVTMSVEAYRIQFFETVKTIWEDSFFYTYFTEEKDIGFQKREFEYLPDGYYLIEEISDGNFKFLQVNEVANVNEAFYKKYDSYKEVVVEDNKNYDVFEKYTKVDVAFDQGYSGMRCYLNEDESFGGAYFRYTFEYETNDENLVDSSIEVYITAEPLEKFEGLLPTIEEADEGNVYSIYDNILYYMENDDNMSLFKTNICTVVFDGSKYSYFCGVIDGEKESYINKYCNVLYNFFQQMYK